MQEVVMELPLKDDYIRFRCRCDYYVDFLRENLSTLKECFIGMDCPICNKSMVRWF